MPTPIKMPALRPTMEEGTLAKWLVKEGDTVRAGDVMAEIETDKATMEFEAVDEGTIAKIEVAEGTEGVKVGTVIALLAGEGEDAAAAAPASRAAKQARTPERPRRSRSASSASWRPRRPSPPEAPSSTPAPASAGATRSGTA